MESETLRNIKTIRQVKTSLAVFKNRKIKMTGSLSKSQEEVEHLELLTDRGLEGVLAKEKDAPCCF